MGKLTVAIGGDWNVEGSLAEGMRRAVRDALWQFVPGKVSGQAVDLVAKRVYGSLKAEARRQGASLSERGANDGAKA